MGWAVFAFLGAFGFAAWLPRHLTRTYSNMIELHYPVRKGLIFAHAATRLYSKGWLLSTLFGSAIVAIGFATLASSPGLVTLALPAGGIVITADAIYRSYRLCHASLRELGFTWPPPKSRD